MAGRDRVALRDEFEAKIRERLALSRTAALEQAALHDDHMLDYHLGAIGMALCLLDDLAALGGVGAGRIAEARETENDEKQVTRVAPSVPCVDGQDLPQSGHEPQ